LEIATTPQTLFAFGINHRTAPVEVREKLYVHETEIPELLDEFRDVLSECVVISTCNRTEMYAVSDQPDVDIDLLKSRLIKFKGAEGMVEHEHFFTLISCAACEQLLNVAASIDSKLVGDSQILRQLRSAYAVANAHRYTGKVLNQLLQRALKIGKKTFTETSIHHGAVSVSLAAVELAIESFGSLKGRSAMVVGAGEIARLTAEALINKRVSELIVTNRTRGHAEELLAGLDDAASAATSVVDFQSFTELLPEVDIVVSSTASDEPIICREHLGRIARKLLLIDLAVPRDIDSGCADVENVSLKNIDDMHSIIDGNHEKRKLDLPKVKSLIMREMVDFLMWYYSLPLMPHGTGGEANAAYASSADFIRVKEFLGQNVSEIHKLAARTTGNFNEDLANHFSLIQRLQSMKVEAFGN
jgi:glutamyl-tRNA reductase